MPNKLTTNINEFTPFKSVIDSKEYNRLRMDMVQNHFGPTFNAIDEKLTGILNSDESKQIMNDQTKRVFKNDVVNFMTGFTHNTSLTTKRETGQYIDAVVSSVCDGENISNSVESLIKNTIKDGVNQIIPDPIKGVVGEITNSLISGIFNGNSPLLSNIPTSINNCLNSLIGGIDSAITGSINNMLNIGDIASNLLNNIGSNFEQSFANFGANLGGMVDGLIQNGIDQLSSKIGIDLNKIIADAGLSIPSISDTMKEGGTDTPTTNNPTGVDSTDKDAAGANKDTPATTTEEDKTIPDDDKPKPQENQSEQQKQDQQQANNESKEQSSVKDRKETDDKGAKSDDPKKPKTETYNDKQPQRSTIIPGPRRDNNQELVLWEKGGEEYVLLRDGVGNYICFNEVGPTIRIQHNSGAYINFDANGNIHLQGNPFIYLNCASPAHIKKF